MTSFLTRYGHAFGRSQALLLRVSGLGEAEVRGDGAWVSDSAGNRWLDFGSFGLHLLGHRHPAIVSAAREQLQKMGLGTRVLGSAAATRAADALLAHTPALLDRVIYANSGGEAVDIAARLVRLATGRPRLIALKGAYHGRIGAALALSDVTGQPHVTEKDAVERVSMHQLSELDERLRRGDVAAVVVEPVQGEGGIRGVPAFALMQLRTACSTTGTMLMLDEIQSGLGRCGSLWAAASEALSPDVLLVGKTLGGGLLPVAAVLYASAAVSDSTADPLLFASSFAGGALATSVAKAVVKTVAEPEFLDRARTLGALALSHLQRELSTHDRVIDVRGHGLMIGVELETPGLAGLVLQQCFSRRLLVTFCLGDPRVLRIYPPAICSKDELAQGLETFVDAVAAAELADLAKTPIPAAVS
jgi:acetylornithine/succinyldiaminopimelate/putrescine aminotransferase